LPFAKALKGAILDLKRISANTQVRRRLGHGSEERIERAGVAVEDWSNHAAADSVTAWQQNRGSDNGTPGEVYSAWHILDGFADTPAGAE
jgi:hypothetical protein